MPERKELLFLHTSACFKRQHKLVFKSVICVAFQKMSGGVTYTNVDTGKTAIALCKRKYPPPRTREVQVQWLRILFSIWLCSRSATVPLPSIEAADGAAWHYNESIVTTYFHLTSDCQPVFD